MYMITTSNIANQIQPSLTRKLFNMAKRYNDVIDFTLGDPDVPTNDAIKQAACNAIWENKTRYSQNAGLLELRKAISKYCEDTENLRYNPETEIIATVGAMEGLYLALLAILNEGDEVIIPAPYYVNYRQMVMMCHATPIIVEDGENADDLQCSFDAIRKAVTKKTKAIILNTPCNPTGKVMSQDFLRQIASLAIEKDLVILTDEVYKCLIYSTEFTHGSIAHLDMMKDRTILINSLSKEFCMTGWRIGYVCAPKEVISAMTKLQENVAACAPLVSQYAAIEALQADKHYSSNMIKIFSRRREVLLNELSDCKKLSCKVPEATFYAMLDIRNTGMKSEEFSYSLLDSAHVAVVPGITYGNMCDNFVRIAFTLEETKLREGIKRIKQFVNTL